MSGGMEWFRWHHGSVDDPKFGLVAARAGASRAEVIAVWACVLEAASAAKARGNPGPIDFEALDHGLGLREGLSRAIHERMLERGLIDPKTGRVVAWERRQPKRERDDDRSTERVRAWRERQAGAGAKTDGTPGNATERHETPETQTTVSSPVAPPLEGQLSTGDSSANPLIHNGNAMKRQETPRGEESSSNTSTTTSLRSNQARANPARARVREGPDGTAGTAGTAISPFQACAAIRAAGFADPRPGDARLAALLAAGITGDELASVAKDAAKGRKSWAWLLTVVEARRHDAQHVGANLPGVHEEPWHQTRSGIERKGAELGIGTWDEQAFNLGSGEAWPIYQARVYRAAGYRGEAA